MREMEKGGLYPISDGRADAAIDGEPAAGREGGTTAAAAAAAAAATGCAWEWEWMERETLGQSRGPFVRLFQGPSLTWQARYGGKTAAAVDAQWAAGYGAEITRGGRRDSTSQFREPRTKLWNERASSAKLVAAVCTVQHVQ